MNTITSVIKRHPLAAFFVLAYTISWLPWLLGTLAPAIAPFVSYPFFTPGPLLAALILALRVTGWHLPLALASGIEQLPPIALLATIAVTFWYAWVYNRSGRSALMTLVAHAAEGVFFQVAMAGFAGANATRLVWL